MKKNRRNLMMNPISGNEFVLANSKDTTFLLASLTGLYYLTISLLGVTEGVGFGCGLGVRC